MKTEYFSSCKINLGLEVLSKRDDGYHNVNTVLYRLSFPQDRFEVRPHSEYTFSASSRDIPWDDTNLVNRAIAACASIRSISYPGLDIYLDKKLPYGAGIGGGSANAAIAINIYSDLVSALSEDEKLNIAKSLGADIPFFMQKERAAIASGIGHDLSPIDFIIKGTILLVKLADVSISTVEAYTHLNMQHGRQPTNLEQVVMGPIEMWKHRLVNDFENYAFSMHPELQEIKEMLYENGANFAQMSGTGSLIYGIFDNIRNSRAAALEVLSYYSDAYVASNLA